MVQTLGEDQTENFDEIRGKVRNYVNLGKLGF